MFPNMSLNDEPREAHPWHYPLPRELLLGGFREILISDEDESNEEFVPPGTIGTARFIENSDRLILTFHGYGGYTMISKLAIYLDYYIYRPQLEQLLKDYTAKTVLFSLKKRALGSQISYGKEDSDYDYILERIKAEPPDSI
jgi:hypothetical protein